MHKNVILANEQASPCGIVFSSFASVKFSQALRVSAGAFSQCLASCFLPNSKSRLTSNGALLVHTQNSVGVDIVYVEIRGKAKVSGVPLLISSGWWWGWNRSLVLTDLSFVGLWLPVFVTGCRPLYALLTDQVLLFNPAGEGHLG